MDDSSSPLSSSMASSVGSPSTDLQELRDLRSQLHDQEELLGQIREALQGTAQRQETQVCLLQNKTCCSSGIYWKSKIDIETKDFSIGIVILIVYPF